jgi:hypothetical protein
MAEKSYTKEELQKIWKRIQPKGAKKEQLRIEILEQEVKQLRSYLYIALTEIGSINARLDRLEGLEAETEIELAKIPDEEAAERISDYVKKNPGSHTSDIIFDLRLDPDVVLKVLKSLVQNGKIKGKEIE